MQYFGVRCKITQNAVVNLKVEQQTLMFSRPKPYKNRATVWEYVLVVLISCSLLGMGGWVWIDNRWAIIPGISDSAQVGLELAALLGAESGEAQFMVQPAEPEGL